MKIIFCKDEMKEVTIDVESWYDDTISYKEKKYIYSVCFTDNMLERFYHFLCHIVKDVVYYNIVWQGEKFDIKPLVINKELLVKGYFGFVLEYKKYQDYAYKTINES